MPTNQSKETHATAAQPKPSIVPDGKSKLPTNIPDFPVTDPNDPPTATKKPA
ncbi:MAG TPA: hypothetical protein VHW23_34815 [Kofleriaceae bacterium]|jgi:hypothetical protein|nr:hypothetical protein [Kofleriaceae bacterium]